MYFKQEAHAVTQHTLLGSSLRLDSFFFFILNFVFVCFMIRLKGVQQAKFVQNISSKAQIILLQFLNISFSFLEIFIRLFLK